MYVLKKNETGEFVARPGSKRSYTVVLENARTFPTREAAQAEACGNETAYRIEELFTP